MKHFLHIVVLILSSLFLAACFGGGNGGGSIPTYTIGGTVSGLEGTGLILQNNNGDDLAISSNGDFIFVSNLKNGNNYTVTVLTQPNSPDQICGVTNGSSTITGANVTNISVTCSKVLPLYNTNGVDWNDYVQGSDIANATDITCVSETDTACLHGGEIRVVEIMGETSCTGITASDSLGAFDWICDDSTGTVRIVSTGLKNGKGLSDLIDFTSPGWKQNSLTTYKDTVEIETTASAVWWTNPVVTNTTGGELNVAGTVYVLSSNTTATYSLWADGIALVAAPGVVINGSPSPNAIYIIDAYFSDFLWVEGMIVNATGFNGGLLWDHVDFSVIRNLTAEYADTGTFKTGIYVNNSSNNKLLSITASHNDGDGVFIGGIVSGNVLSNITANSNGTNGLVISGTGTILSNITANNNGAIGLTLAGTSDSILSNITANANTTGIESGSNATLTNVTAGYNTRIGINIGSNSKVSNLAAIANGEDGIIIGYSCTILNMTASNNAWSGIRLATSSNNKLTAVRANNNYVGIDLWSSSNNVFTDLTASNNSIGVYLTYLSNNNVISGVSANNNSFAGIKLENSSDNMFLNILTSNNNSGIVLDGTYWAPLDNNTFSNTVVSNNTWSGIYLNEVSNGYFTNSLMVGNNNLNCNVTGGTDSGLVHDTCANNGLSDALLTIGVDITNSFVEKITVDDTMNTSDANGTANITDFASSFDWTSFENLYRSWGRDGGAFPDAGNQGLLGCSNISNASAYTNQTDCEANAGIWSGNAHIWDWSLLAADTVVKSVLSLPTGNETITHTWSYPGSVTMLRNTVEVMDDGIGNENTLCESGETCLYTPNIGAYQGHGNLISAGSIGTGGSLENITLMKYQTNGY
ncbi:MAG: right-handed parallel beta-helix repeat-containing protein [Gammaproteobacteria bacterium]|nr:right-handed parallel beta-helix repeat-containing protein [Gammaproteobacteria bacterium]